MRQKYATLHMRFFPEPTLKHLSMAFVRIVVLTYFFFGVMLYLRQDALLYFPDSTAFTECEELADTLHVSMDGVRGYFFQNGSSTKLAVLYHGNAGRACDRAYYRSVFTAAGYSWLFVEYAGYAGDERKPTTERVLRDVVAVEKWVGSGNFSSVALVGESIGAGAAAYHASLRAPDHLVLITPFDRLSRVAQEYYPLYPITLLLHDDYDVVNWARSAKRVLIIHGSGDTIIPIAHTERLWEELPQSDKQLLVLPGIDHNEVPALGTTQIEITKFIKDN